MSQSSCSLKNAASMNHYVVAEPGFWSRVRWMLCVTLGHLCNVKWQWLTPFQGCSSNISRKLFMLYSEVNRSSPCVTEAGQVHGERTCVRGFYSITSSCAHFCPKCHAWGRTKWPRMTRDQGGRSQKRFCRHWACIFFKKGGKIRKIQSWFPTLPSPGDCHTVIHMLLACANTGIYLLNWSSMEVEFVFS